MVLYLRRASSFASVSYPTDSKDSASVDPLAASRSTYQEALKLLQDPLLPVRAQGLALLRSLISTRSAFLSTDPALLPAVLDIMVQALEDEDSFLYLNAIQGLSSMADVYGKQIVARLVEVYMGGQGDKSRREVGLGEKGRRELDKRLRMGEALVQVVQRAGETLAVFGELSRCSSFSAFADPLELHSRRPHPLPSLCPPHAHSTYPAPFLSPHHPRHRHRKLPSRPHAPIRPPHRSLSHPPHRRISSSAASSTRGASTCSHSASREVDLGRRERLGGGRGGAASPTRSQWETS